MRIDLQIRTFCTIKAGVPGLSENIHTRSILGRFLEHSRIFHFQNDDDPDAGSVPQTSCTATWTVASRCWFRCAIRVARANTCATTLDLAFAEDTAAWDLQADGRWVRTGGGNPVDYQQRLMKLSLTAAIAGWRRPCRTSLTAAGGVVWRMTRSGVCAIAVIHRPRRDDWSLPKGKLLTRRTQLVGGAPRGRRGDRASRRRVSIGWARCVTGSECSQDRHLLGHACSRRLVRAQRRGATCCVGVARQGARRLLDVRPRRFHRRLRPRSRSPIRPSLLVRHAKAGKRSTWKKDDRLRPLDASGRAQASPSADAARCSHPMRILRAARCAASRRSPPLAAVLDLTVRALRRSPTPGSNVARTAPSTPSPHAVASGGSTVVSSQGVVIPGAGRLPVSPTRPARQPQRIDLGAVLRRRPTWWPPTTTTARLG